MLILIYNIKHCLWESIYQNLKKTKHSNQVNHSKYNGPLWACRVSKLKKGWRTKMEDSHIAECNLPGNVSIFGVFDGHGGAEVALYVKKYFLREIQQNANFKTKNYELALTETFFKMDEMLLTPEGQKER